MNTKHLSFYIIGLGTLTSAFIVGVALAQTPAGSANASISYPIAELGNCKNKDACKTYCDDPAHLETCISFGEKNNLMSKDEVNIAKKFLNAGAKGPGGCTSKDSCETYCNDIKNINECVAFAEKSGILPPDQLAEAKQVQSAIARGVQPPPCKNKKECDAYCDNPSNIKVCVTFGEAAGFLSGQELENAKKMITAIDKGATPPPCRGKEACDAYCSSPDNIEACVTFAQAAGFMSPQEAQDSQKMLTAIKKGVKPPACSGKEACDRYCSDSSHIDECVNFSVAAGFMSAKDAETAKKTGGKGPGGCKSKEECDSFCSNPDNQQTCINFAKDNGLISSEELQQMQGGQGGPGGQGFGQGNQPGSGTTNPGGQQMSQQAGPGGCKTPEECKTFCQGNPEACKNFQPPMMQPRGQERQGEIQPNMPQGQGESGRENFGKMMPFLEGKPIQRGLPLGTTPPTRNMPPGGIPSQQRIEQMMQPDNIQQLLQGIQSGNLLANPALPPSLQGGPAGRAIPVPSGLGAPTPPSTQTEKTENLLANPALPPSLGGGPVPRAIPAPSGLGAPTPPSTQIPSSAPPPSSGSNP